MPRKSAAPPPRQTKTKQQTAQAPSEALQPLPPGPKPAKVKRNAPAAQAKAPAKKSAPRPSKTAGAAAASGPAALVPAPAPAATDDQAEPVSLLSGLNARQERFVLEYAISNNATQSAITAGYSERTAASQGHDLLKKPEIAAALATLRARAVERAELTQELVLRELKRLVLFDPRSLFDEAGAPLPVHRLGPEAAAAIAGLEVVTKGNAEMGFGEVLKYRIADKNSAIEKAMRHLGMFERDNRQQSPLAEIMALVQQQGSRLPLAGGKK